MTPIFLGQVKDGKLSLDKAGQFKNYLHTLNGKRVELTVEKLKHPRTNSQNRYYFGVVCKLIAQHTGHDAEQIHEALKQMFAPKWFLGDKPIPTSTTRLDTIEFESYLEQCRHWAESFLGVVIPLPNEVNYEAA
jgi:hypothetical protein